MTVNSPLHPLASPSLSVMDRTIKHGFFNRLGGVSKGIYQSLNTGLGSGDDGEIVTTNRMLVCDAMGAGKGQLATLNQVHSADAVIAEKPFGQELPRADGVVTRMPGLVIGILTADCGPVLFADVNAGIVGAAHAGWKGAMTGVLENTIEAMIRLGARRENIVATLGPCISQKNYEVGPEYFSTFTDEDSSNRRYFVNSDRDGHFMFDLPSYVVDRLNAAGITGGMLGICTYQEQKNFYSYRRSVHNKEPDYGRQISAIMVR